MLLTLKRVAYAATHPYETLTKLEASDLRKALLCTLFAFWCLVGFVVGLLYEPWPR